LKTHKNLLHDGVRYACDLCEHKATQVGSLKKHLQAIHGIHKKHENTEKVENKVSDINFEPECNSITNAVQENPLHQTGEFGKDIWDDIVHAQDNKYWCKICDTGYKTENDRSRHQEVKHGTDMQCDRCEYKTSVKRMMVRHTKVIHEGVRYNCNQCDKRFTSVGIMVSHKRVVHEGRRFQCDKCDYSSTNNKNLTRHKESKHQNIKHACDQCTSEYTSKEKLANHKKTIHEGKWFTCDECDHRESYPGKLLLHKQRMHPIIEG
jgi:hypothetical protein